MIHYPGLNNGRSSAASPERQCGRDERLYRYKRFPRIGNLRSYWTMYKKAEPPKVNVGDTVRVHLRVKEGNRERIQVFEGTVIAKKHGGIEESFTVRRISYGIGVEKVFPLHAPSVEKVEVVRRGKVRRAKLYYLRDRVGKAAKVKELL